MFRMFRWLSGAMVVVVALSAYLWGPRAALHHVLALFNELRQVVLDLVPPEHELDALSRQRDAARGELAKMAEDLAGVENELAEAGAEARSVAQQAALVRHKIAGLDGYLRLNDAQYMIDGVWYLRPQLAAEREALQAQLVELERREMIANERQGGLVERRRSLQQSLEQERQGIAQLETKLTRLEAQVQAEQAEGHHDRGPTLDDADQQADQLARKLKTRRKSREILRQGTGQAQTPVADALVRAANP